MSTSGIPWSWGFNNYGQLGNGTNTSSNVPVTVSDLSNVITISAGGSHSLALLEDGTVQAWGYNSYGQLGNGTNTSSNVPVTVSDLSNVIAVSAGAYHSLALF
ncbi:MAG: repeat domain protein [Firmicutes bacterium]|nr:repeat domain protein [Bacillota bacterium]